MRGKWIRSLSECTIRKRRLQQRQLRTFSSEGSYDVEGGRLNLPFVGIPSFAKAPIVSLLSDGRTSGEDIRRLDGADFVVLGAPFDFGTQYRPGARFGPRAIRESSTLYCFGHTHVYDHEVDTSYSYGSIVDVGDVDIVHTDTEQSHANIESAVRHVLTRTNAIPVLLGGDHSITSASLQAFSERDPIHVVQIDAHLDFVDERFGVRHGHGNCMRRAAEMSHVSGLSQLGIRGVSSTSKEGYETARQMGSTIRSVRQCREMGTSDVVPENSRIYITIDIDGFDPSIAPGTGTPSHGGFTYYEVQDILRELCSKHKVEGIDVVEVAPAYDHADITSQLAARVVLDTLGFIVQRKRG